MYTLSLSMFSFFQHERLSRIFFLANNQRSQCLNNCAKPKHHYKNTPIQIYRKFHLQKLKIFQIKNSDIFSIYAKNIDCGYSLEPPWQSGSNKSQQSIFFEQK